MNIEDFVSFSEISGNREALEEFVGRMQRVYDYLVEGDTAKALSEAETASVALEAADPAQHRLVFPAVLRKLGFKLKALAGYKKEFEKEPENPRTMEGLLLCLLDNGESEEADVLIRENESLIESDTRLKILAGVVSLRTGSRDSAREFFLKANAPDLARKIEETGTDATSREVHTIRDADLTKSMELSALAAWNMLPDSHEGRIRLTPGGGLIIDLDGETCSRLDGMKLVAGSGLHYEAAKRRVRGKDTGEIFGPENKPMFRIKGSGRLGFSLSEGVMLVIEASDQPVYIREDLVFCFDPEIYWENGRLPPAPGQSPIPLVHLRGSGRIGLHLAKYPSSIEVTPARGVLIPRSSLIAWAGRLIPREITSSPFEAGTSALEFTGEGVLLFAFN